MGVFIGFKVNDAIFGCKHACHIESSYKKIDEIIKGYAQTHTAKDIRILFDCISWSEYDENTDAPNGSLLLSLIKQGNIDSYKLDLHKTIML